MKNFNAPKSTRLWKSPEIYSRSEFGDTLMSIEMRSELLLLWRDRKRTNKSKIVSKEVDRSGCSRQNIFNKQMQQCERKYGILIDSRIHREQLKYNSTEVVHFLRKLGVQETGGERNPNLVV